uniref:Uncharacterized protein n=1 Tax=Triticum urartu TaxID=4572 RepID=A0A8R7P0P1_TRIUA
MRRVSPLLHLLQRLPTPRPIPAGCSSPWLSVGNAFSSAGFGAAGGGASFSRPVLDHGVGGGSGACSELCWWCWLVIVVHPAAPMSPSCLVMGASLPAVVVPASYMVSLSSIPDPTAFGVIRSRPGRNPCSACRCW